MLLFLEQLKVKHDGGLNGGLILAFNCILSKKVFLRLFEDNTDIQANLCSLIRGTRIEGRSEEGIETLSKHSFDPYLLSLKKDFLQKDASVVYYGKLYGTTSAVAIEMHFLKTCE